MSNTTLAALWRIVSSLQAISMGALALLALALGLSLALSLAGLIPSLDVLLALSDGTAMTVGPVVHGIAFLIALVLLTYMPANWRMRRLEAGHRSFRVGMEDVTRAYVVAHAADREGVFTYAAEYDAVRERLAYLADHPDLGHLEPELLEVAAQMSRVSEGLAQTYSTEAVARAKIFLSQRQDEVARMEERIETALAACRELRQWNAKVEMDEDVVQSRLNQLKAELDDLLPEMGLAPPRPANSSSEVIRMEPRRLPRDVAAE